ncbi:MAG: YncE family protein [Candidatus Korobacteraceae bacterium]
MPSTRIIRLVFLGISATLMALPSVAQQLIATVPVGLDPYSVAVNTITNKIYVANEYGNSVTVIDGGTFSTITIPVQSPTYLAVNETTNKIYVSTIWSEVTVIDGATNSTTQVQVSAPEQLAVNPITNRIYVVGAFNGVTVIDGSTLSTVSVPVGTVPVGVAVNQITNKIYITNQYGYSVTVIDGVTNSTVTVPVGQYPGPIAVNPYTNKIYVLNTFSLDGNATVTVIDGATLSTTTFDVGTRASALALNIFTNKVYVIVPTDQYDNFITVINGTTLSRTTIPLGLRQPIGLAVEPVSNKIYFTYQNYGHDNGLVVINGDTDSVTLVATGNVMYTLAVDSVADRIYVADPADEALWVVAGPVKTQFIPVTPCRVVDTRNPDGQFGGPPISGGAHRDFPIPQGSCNIPTSAAAYSMNITVVPLGYLGYLTVWPTGENQPQVSTMNSLDGRVKANAAIVPAGANEAVSIFASDSTNVVVDINGYFQRPTGPTLAFYPLTPCRVADTRGPNGLLGGPRLIGGQERDFPVLAATACGIPATAQAYSFNLTAVPKSTLGYLTVWPAGQNQPIVSTLNAPTGVITANAAIVPAGENGDIAVFPSDDTDLVIDVSGYFAPPSTGGLSLYSLLPCRVLDTRKTRGAFTGTLLVDVIDSGCGVSEAEAFVLNATVVPQGSLGYLTVWPTTEFKPLASTLNAVDGAVTSNMVIVPNIDGWLDVFASSSTNLILDSFSYFAP